MLDWINKRSLYKPTDFIFFEKLPDKIFPSPYPPDSIGPFGFKWLQTEAPQYIEAPVKTAFPSSTRPPIDIQMVSTLAGAQDKLLGTPKGNDAYLALKQAALAGETNNTHLRKQIKEARNDALRTKPIPKA